MAKNNAFLTLDMLRSLRPGQSLTAEAPTAAALAAAYQTAYEARKEARERWLEVIITKSVKHLVLTYRVVRPGQSPDDVPMLRRGAADEIKDN